MRNTEQEQIWERGLDWHLRSLVCVLVCAVIVVMFRCGIIPSGLFVQNGSLLFPLSDAFVIVGAGLCGYHYGLVMFLAIIFGEQFDPNVVNMLGLFPLFLYLMLALVTGVLSERRMFLNIRRTLISYILLETLLAVLFHFIFVVLMQNELDVLSSVIGTMPESLAAVMFLYVFFKYAPEGVLKSFGMGFRYINIQYGKEFSNSQKTLERLNYRITLLSLMEGIVFSVLAVLFASGYETFFEGLTLYEELQGLSLNVMLFLLSLTVCFSVVLLFNEIILAVVSRLARQQQITETELAVAKARSDAKSTFLSSMSHEIRTPINAVLGMNEMILRESEEEETLQYAESVRTAGNTLLGLVNDILDFSKIEAGKMDIIPVDYSLSSVLNDLVNMIKTRAEEKELDFIVEVNPDIPDRLCGDEIRIKQIATNILTNAVKYTKQGSVRMLVTYEDWGGKEIELQFVIKDTGIGIKPENIDKLFTAFERIEEERNRTIEGTGLGMNITHRLVQQMGGDIHVASEYGKGSTFTFTIKQQVVDPASIGDFDEKLKTFRHEHRAYHESFTAPDARVLVVDDTEMNLVVFKGLLKKTKVQIDTAKSGFVCLEKCGRRSYDLIFLDHRMPDKDGMETLSDLRKLGGVYADIPVVCLTANAIAGAKEAYLAAGFTDYLTKPIDADALERMMIRLLPENKVNISEASVAPIDTSQTPADDYMTEAQKIYVEDIDRSSGMIEAYFHAQDWENYTIKVHALKSSSRLIGEEELGALAERLEHAGDAGDIWTIKRLTSELLTKYRALSEKYAYLLKSDSVSKPSENTGKEPITDAVWNDAIAAIREFAAAFDEESILQIMEQLSAYRMTKEQEEKTDAIRKALKELDWERLIHL